MRSPINWPLLSENPRGKKLKIKKSLYKPHITRYLYTKNLRSRLEIKSQECIKTSNTLAREVAEKCIYEKILLDQSEKIHLLKLRNLTHVSDNFQNDCINKISIVMALAALIIGVYNIFLM